MTADLMMLLWHATLASSLAIVLVLVVRKPLRHRFGAQVAYSLWAFVPVAIAVSLIPAPIATDVAAPLPIPLAPPTVSSSMPLAPSVAAPIDIAFWLSCGWLVGVALWTLWLAHQQRRFLAELGRLDRYDDNAWRAQNVTSCPALIGAIRPRIVLPRDFDERYTATERTLILAHEHTHVARADATLNLGVSALRCVFWFNPLIHAAASRFRFDQELACDASVISRFPEARRPYADAMLKTQLADRLGMEPRLPVGCHWQSSHPLKERISMLKSSLPSPRRKRIGVVLSAVFVVGIATIAWAEQPKRLTQPTPDEGDISTDLRIKIDGNNLDGWSFHADGHNHYVHDSADSSAFLLGVPSGHAFNLVMNNGSDSWSILATPEREADGTLQFSADLSHNGAVISRPMLHARENEAAGIKIGEVAADGSFKGFEAQVMMTSSPTVSSAVPAQHASYRSITRIEYPATQAKAGIGGTVFVVAHVAVDGHVVSTSLKAGTVDTPDASPLVTAALAGVQRWTFNPAQRDGKAVPSDEIVPVVFEGSNPHNVSDLSGALDAITIRLPNATADVIPTDQAPNEDVQFRMSRPPKYPVAAIKAHQQGKIMLKVLISETGEPLSASVESATPPEAEAVFADASISAVMNWRFNPGLHNGKPYQGYASVPFTYSLTDDDDKPADSNDNG